MRKTIYLTVLLLCSLKSYAADLAEYTSRTQVAEACTPIATASETLTWTGAISTDWGNPCNWSPIGVPGSGNPVTIPASPANQPVIMSGTLTTPKSVLLLSDASLTIASGGELQLNDFRSTNATETVSLQVYGTLVNSGIIRAENSTIPGSCVIQIETTGSLQNTTSGYVSIDRSANVNLGIKVSSGRLNNEGKLYIGEKTGCGVSAITLLNGASIHNLTSGDMRCSNSIGNLLQLLHTSTFTNEGECRLVRPTGNNITISDLSTFNNKPTGRLFSNSNIYLAESTFENEGEVSLTKTALLANYVNATINNRSCGRIYVNHEFWNTATSAVLNQGYIEVRGTLGKISNVGSFVNGGVLSYLTLENTGTFTNAQNSSMIVNNASTSIFNYGGLFDGTVDGIFRDKAANEPAGAFTAPNLFSPSATLPPGTQTLYAKVTPAGASCEFIVPFIYQVIPLPVTLLSFSGSNTTEKQHVLKWITAEEKEFGHFEIERSRDARSFETIGQVNGSGRNETARPRSYQFIANQNSGAGYYRLKMVDRDLSFSHSSIIFIKTPSEKTVVGSFYPNPANGHAFVDIEATNAGTWNITAFDLNGSVIYRQTRTLQKGPNKLILDRLPVGINLVRFENGNDHIVRKLTAH